MRNLNVNQSDNRQLRDHENYNLKDAAYLRNKGYTRQEILALWDRDASQGKGQQRHQHTAK